MAEYMRGDLNAGLFAERPEEIVHVRIVHRLSGILSPQLQEHMVCIDITGMDFADISHEQVCQFLCAIQLPRAVYCLDLCQVLQFPAVCNRYLQAVNVKIFQPQGKCLPDTHPRFKQKIEQKVIADVCTFPQKRHSFFLLDPPDFPMGNRHLQNAASGWSVFGYPIKKTLIAPLWMCHKLHQLLRQTVLKSSAPDKIIVETDHLIDGLIDTLLLTGRLKPERNHLFQQVWIPQPGHKHGDIINGHIPVVFSRFFKKPIVILKLIAAQPQGIPCFSLVIQELQVIHHLWNGSTLFISQIVSGFPVRGCTCHSIHWLYSFLKNAQSNIYCIGKLKPLFRSFLLLLQLHTAATAATVFTHHEFLLYPPNN